MQPLAFVDLETTGGSATKDRIIEIAMVLVDDDGVREWSQLIQPQIRIPLFIEQLTGISNAMVANAPDFDAVAAEVDALLQGRLFIAHNARFDYGFLKNEFKRLGMLFKPQVLCTVKLSRTLYPQYERHNLDSLISRHQLQTKQRHRALADAQLIYQFWQQATQQFSAEVIQATVKNLVQYSSLPSQLDPNLVHELPESPGVYLFYGENDLPLYIGKSINIRQRVLSHFSADHRNGKEMSLSQQTKRIDWIETGGELGALLTEARLIKHMMPIHNQRLRRKNALCAWQLQQKQDQLLPQLAWANDLDFGEQDNLYGLYSNQRDAQKSLRSLAEQHQLCLGLLGLEKIGRGKPCFAHQLKRCRGVCVGKESSLEHATRLLNAMSKLKLASWPYPGTIGIREADELHVIDHWCYLGTARSDDEVKALLQQGRPAFDRDTYMTLLKALKSSQIVHLSSQSKLKTHKS
ncbi:MAG: 3'-5' exoribonuclease [Methylovulum sp.]|jgi:DNA polymerase-3 subunit epsilon|nr:3'-5' exoribonuclease [Methylovulum sp.]